MYKVNLDSKLVTKHATLRKIKQEYLTRNRISNDVFVDAQTTKLLMDNLLCSASKSNLKGFVQEIGLHPYGFLLLCDIQVKKDKNHIFNYFSINLNFF